VAVDSACKQLTADVRKLKESLALRASELEMALKTYALLEEINEIEGWIQVG
jgi:predicted Holliday junction resolvase-like endonuclease